MRIHHLNCGTMCPFGGRLLNGDRPFYRRAKMVAHVLVVEGANGLTVVDTGFGVDDVHLRDGRIEASFRHGVGPLLREDETVIRQIERLGFSPGDVRDIVLTHLDVDHAGGISDFPDASVHVFADEHRAAMQPATLKERKRYRQAQWKHGPRWAVHALEGDRWLGLESVRAVGDDVVLIPTAGHTRGHCVVAVRNGDNWLLHCGDAYFYEHEMDVDNPRGTPLLNTFQTVMAVNNKLRVQNQQRLRALKQEHGSRLTMFSAHDPNEFERLSSTH